MAEGVNNGVDGVHLGAFNAGDCFFKSGMSRAVDTLAESVLVVDRVIEWAIAVEYIVLSALACCLADALQIEQLGYLVCCGDAVCYWAESDQ